MHDVKSVKNKSERLWNKDSFCVPIYVVSIIELPF